MPTINASASFRKVTSAPMSRESILVQLDQLNPLHRLQAIAHLEFTLGRNLSLCKYARDRVGIERR